MLFTAKLTAAQNGRSMTHGDGSMNTWMRSLIVMGILSAIPQLCLAADACLKYEDVSLAGVLVRQTYPGPPDYESVTKGDEPQIIWVLLLDTRICVIDPDSRLPAEHYQREVQLVLAGDKDARDLLGTRVIATGKLLRGGARYDKPLVLMASAIKRTGVLP